MSISSHLDRFVVLSHVIDGIVLLAVIPFFLLLLCSFISSRILYTVVVIMIFLSASLQGLVW